MPVHYHDLWDYGEDVPPPRPTPRQVLGLVALWLSASGLLGVALARAGWLG